MAVYDFEIPGFHIEKIRSSQTDTLFASTALKVLNASGGLHHDYGAQAASLGDRKAGGGVGLTSTLVGGAGRDAALVRHMARRRNVAATSYTQPRLEGVAG
jgi:hypothetical protein